MSGFSFAVKPPAVPDKPLKDAPPVLLKEDDANAKYEGEMELSGIKFSLNAEATGRIEALNDKTDKDSEGVFGEPRKDDGDFTVQLDPLLRADGERGWTKYRFKAGGKVSAEAKWTALGVNLDAEKGFIFADYHAHPIGTNTKQAVVSDLSSLKLATRTDDVLGLGEGDALTFQTYGRLSAGVTLSWSDVFTAGLGSVANLVQSGTTLSVNVSASASVEFKASLTDDFRVVFTKAGEGVRVSVLKSKTRELGLKASLGVKAEFADPKDAEKYLNELFEAVAGEAVEKIDKLFADFTADKLIAQLPGPVRPLAEALVARIGQDGPLETVGALKEKWEAVKKKVEENIKKAAKTKVEAGFAYEYLRVSAEDTLLDVDLPADKFREFHTGLVAGYLTDATDWARENPKALHKYLRQKSVKRTHAWGFTLGISPFGIQIGGKDKLEKTLVVQENIEGFQRVAYNGVRSYEAKWMFGDFKWAADFKAQTPGFSANKLPTTCDFEYGLSFNWGWDDKKLKADELRDLLDHAVIWRAVSAADAGSIFESLAGDVGGTAQASLELSIDDAALRPLLGAVAAGSEASPDHPGLSKNDVLGTLALGTAMPFWEPFEVRRSALVRKTLYAPLWEVYFRDGDNKGTPRDYAKTARMRLPEIAARNHIDDLQGLEGREGTIPLGNVSPDIHTFTGQIVMNGDIDHMDNVHNNWRKFIEGLSRLDAATRPGGCVSYKTNAVSDIFDQLKGFWSQALFLRAAGVYLLGLASVTRFPDDPKIPEELRRQLLVKGIKRSLTIKFAEGGEGGKGKTVVYSSAG
ncbi:MAG: hypothetical protein ABW250_00330 [Pyrinomonadaceae bacterium]